MCSLRRACATPLAQHLDQSSLLDRYDPPVLPAVQAAAQAGRRRGQEPSAHRLSLRRDVVLYRPRLAHPHRLHPTWSAGQLERRGLARRDTHAPLASPHQARPHLACVAHLRAMGELDLCAPVLGQFLSLTSPPLLALAPSPVCAAHRARCATGSLRLCAPQLACRAAVSSDSCPWSSPARDRARALSAPRSRQRALTVGVCVRGARARAGRSLCAATCRHGAGCPPPPPPPPPPRAQPPSARPHWHLYSTEVRLSRAGAVGSPCGS